MKDIGVEQIKVLSDPNRLAILSLLTMKEMTTSHVSELLGLSIQNAQYHIKKLLEADLIAQTRTGMVGNLVEKYYRSQFEPGMVSDVTDKETVDISERLNLVFAAMGAIKGILNHGITTLDEKRESYFVKVGERPRYPFGVNYIILPINEKSTKEADQLMIELDQKMKELSDKHDQGSKAKFAVVYAVFPYE